MADDRIRPGEEIPERESTVVRLFRNPLVVGLALLATVGTAFQVAGVTSMLLASVILAAGVWIFTTAEVWCSKWVKKCGRYASGIVLLTSGLSGGLAVGLAVKIAELKIQQTGSKTITPKQSEVRPPESSPAPKTPIQPPQFFSQRTKPFHIHIDRIEPHGIVAGQPLAVNVYYSNDGDVDGEFKMGANIAPSRPPPDLDSSAGRQVEKNLEDKIAEDVRAHLTVSDAPTLTLRAHSKAWNTVDFKGDRTRLVLGPDVVQSLLSTQAIARAFVIWRYKSGGKEIDTELCVMWNADPRVIIDCPGHNVDRVVAPTVPKKTQRSVPPQGTKPAPADVPAPRDESPSQREPQPVPPILVGLRFTEALLPSSNPAWPYILQVTIQTDKKLEPVALVVKCSGELLKGDAGIGNAVFDSPIVGVTKEHGDWLIISWRSPAFTPELPIIATVYSKAHVKVLSVDTIPWNQIAR